MLIMLPILFSMFAITRTISRINTSNQTKAAERAVRIPKAKFASLIKKSSSQQTFLFQAAGQTLYQAKMTGEQAAREFIKNKRDYIVNSTTQQTGFLFQSTETVDQTEPVISESLADSLQLSQEIDDSTDQFLKNQGINVNTTHYYYQQTAQVAGETIPVFAGQTSVHINNQNQVYAFSNNTLNSIPELSATISKEQAQETAIAQMKADTGIMTQPTIIEISKYVFNDELIGNSTNSQSYLTYAVTLHSDETSPPSTLTYFVNMGTNKVVYIQNHVYEALNRKITSQNPPITRNESQPETGNKSVDNTYTYLGDVYNSFFNSFGRDSIDAKGKQLVATILSPNTCKPPNAYYDDKNKTFSFCPDLIAKDVIAHEFTHGVTEYTNGGLLYEYQSGALNEAFSDIFASYVDNKNWTMGEETNLGTVRSLENPPQFKQPDKLSSSLYSCKGKESDSGGVHINGGIIAKAYYLMANGGSFNGCTITGITVDKAITIMYRARTYLSQASNFLDFYNKTIQACNELYGTGSNTCAQVVKAFMATEIDQQTSNTQRSPTCEGRSLAKPTCSISSSTTTITPATTAVTPSVVISPSPANKTQTVLTPPKGTKVINRTERQQKRDMKQYEKDNPGN